VSEALPRSREQIRDEHARRWHDLDAAESYRYRPSYPAETFEMLDSLIPDGPRAVLDVGCGTGNVTRPLAARVERVDAVDFAPEMVAVAQTLPGGDSPNIRWQVARAEDAVLTPPYALVVGGASFHWACVRR
jgi:trans-aconitate methyltransferase